MMQFQLREWMWWFVLATALAAPTLSSAARTSLTTMTILYCVPLLMTCVYLWVEGERQSRRWMVLVAFAAIVAVGIGFADRGTYLFVRLFTPLKGPTPMSSFVSSGTGFALTASELVVLLASLAGVMLLLGRKRAGIVALLILVIGLVCWGQEVQRIQRPWSAAAVFGGN